MLIDPGTLVKGATLVVKPLLAQARQQWHRRGASPLTKLEAGTVDRELREALDTLTGDAATLGQWAGAKLKALASARPDVFDDENARGWLRMDAVRAVLKDATLALVAGDEIDSRRAEAALLYQDAVGDADWYGGVLFDYAVAFLSLTLDARTSTETRLIIETVNRRADALQTGIMGVHGDLGEFKRELLYAVGRNDGISYPAAVVTDHLRHEVEIEERARAIEDPNRVARLEALARGALDGAFKGADIATRVLVYRLVAAALSRHGGDDEARGWLDAAIAAGAQEVAPDEARLACNRDDWATALRLLSNRTDALSQTIIADAIRRRDGEAEALSYCEKHVAPATMTGFHLVSFATWLAHAERWDDAERVMAAATAEQIAENPPLLFQRARIRLCLLSPAGERVDLYDNASAMPPPHTLRDDPEGLRLRSAAISDLAELEPLLANLRQPSFAETVEVLRFFLVLAGHDGPAKEAVRERLLELVGDPINAVFYAWLALEFGIEFDTSPLEARLDQKRALEGWDAAHLMTAFNLLLKNEKDGDRILDFVTEHHDALIAVVPLGLAVGIQIEILAKKGRIAEARATLDEWRDRLGPSTSGKLDVLIDEQTGNDPVALWLANFQRTNEDSDLGLLVRALADADDRRAADYAVLLWRRRYRTSDAILACNAFFNAGRDVELDAFLIELGVAVDASASLRRHAAWAALRAGELEDAQTRLMPLRADAPDDPSLRQLQISVAMEGGDWHGLVPLVREDLARAEHRDARQLLQAADIAHAIEDPSADGLTRAAVAKSPDDPAVLMHAFMQAVRRGSDWESEAGGWLQRSIVLSGDDGLVQRMTLRDFPRLRDEQNERGLELDRLIMSGQVPLALAAKPLGTTVSELILDRLAGNAALRDARGRLCLPLVAGNRLKVDMTGVDRVGFDPAALLMLQLCGLLDAALDAFPSVVIPAGTLPLLFSDLVRAQRGQRSRVEQAKRIAALQVEGRITVFEEEIAEDSYDVIHAVAQRLDGFAVHTSPLYEPGSYNEEIRDASPFADRLVSPLGIVDALELTGEIDGTEAEAARSSIRSLGEKWIEEANVDNKRPLVFDIVSLHALDDAAVLEPLLRLGANIHVGRSAITLANRQIREWEQAASLLKAINGVRATLRVGLTSRRIRIGPYRRDGDGRSAEVEREIQTAPLVALLQDASSIDALISGDRMINQHGNFIDRAGTSRAVLTVIDVIDQLERTGVIDARRRGVARRDLREAGVGLVPLEFDEVVAAVTEGDWARGPGRALRAIGDSVHLSLLRKAPIFPADRHWIEGATMSLTLAIRRSWSVLPPGADAKASDFLFRSLPNVAAWAARDEAPDAAAWASSLLAISHAMLAVPIDVPGHKLEAYHRWYEGRVMERLDGRDAHVLPDMLERVRLVVVAERTLGTGEDGEIAPSVQDVSRAVASHLSPRHLDSLVEDDGFRAALGTPGGAIDVDGVDVALDAFLQFLQSTLRGDIVSLIGLDGTIVAEAGIDNADGTVSIARENGRLRFDSAGLVADDVDTRSQSLEALFATRTLSPGAAARWRAAIVPGPLAPDLFMALMETVRATPEAFVQSISRTEAAALTFEQLAALDARYFDNLLGVDDPSLDLPSLISRLQELRAAGSDLEAAARAMAPLAISPDFSLGAMVRELNDEAATRLCDRLVEDGDAFSLLAAFEVAAARSSSPTCRATGDRILHSLFGLEGRLPAVAHDFAAAAKIAMGVADARNALAGQPLPHRRCALLMHAGHAARALGYFEIQRPDLFKAVEEWIGSTFRLVGIVERGDGPEWFREWLMPEVVAAYLARRFDAVIAAMPDAARPPEWTAILADHATTMEESGALILAQVRGPLEEFSTNAAPQAAIETAEAIPLLAGLSPDAAVALLFDLVFALRPPDDGVAMRDAVICLIRRCEANERQQAIDVALAAAGHWRDAELGEAIIAIAFAERDAAGWSHAKLGEWAAAAAGAHPDEDARAEAVARHIEVLAFGPLTSEQAADFEHFIDVLANAKRRWATKLERARTTTLLAS